MAMNTNVTARRNASKAATAAATPATEPAPKTPSKYGNGKIKKRSNLTVYLVVGALVVCVFISVLPVAEEQVLHQRNGHHPNFEYEPGNVRRAKRSSSNSNSHNNNHNNSAEEAARNLGKHEQNNKKNNPYEGWQPTVDLSQDSTDPASKCHSWRSCFLQTHNCPGRCRVSESDLGEPPARPSLKDDSTTPWIPDVTVLRRMLEAGVDANGNPFPPPLVTETDHELCEPIGNFGGTTDENRIPLEKIPIRGQALDDPNPMSESKMKRRPRVMCIVYTMEENHATNIRAIRETWGPGCDGFLAFSTRDDPRIPAISIPHDGPEAYGNMWQKVRSIWRFVGTHYLEDFDFFFQGGEDLYVLPQNLRSYLSTAVEDPTKDDFFGGRRFQWGKQEIYFNSGGAGYTLSQATLRKLVETGLDHQGCFPTKTSSMEDVFIARCLKDVFDIGIVDTRDSEERERFHPFAPAAHYNYNLPKDGEKDWYFDYNKKWLPKLREQCCAPDSVSFHYMKKPAMVRHIHALLYFCGDDISKYQ